LSEQVRQLPEVRVGSSPDALTPISMAERWLGAGLWQWLSFALVVVCAFGADQLTKWLVSSRLALGSSVSIAGSLKISHVQNSGIAFVHQELNLFDNLDVAANIFVGREPLAGGLRQGVRKAVSKVERRRMTASGQVTTRRSPPTASPP